MIIFTSQKVHTIMNKLPKFQGNCLIREKVLAVDM